MAVARFTLALLLFQLSRASPTGSATEHNDHTSIPSDFRNGFGAGRQVCEAFAQDGVSDCTLVPATERSTALQVSVQICQEQPGSSSGSIIISNTSLTHTLPHPAATNVYRVRLVGPEVVVLPITYCSSQLVLATFSVTFPGTYFLEVLHLYEAFTFADVTPMLRNIALARAMVNVNAAVGAAASRDLAGEMSCVGDSCPTCKSADAPGRWLLRPDLAANLSQTCPPLTHIPFCHHADALNAVATQIDDSVLRWQPYGCSLRPPGQTAACRATVKNACFFGDSQVRHLYSGLVNPDFNTNASWGQTDRLRPHFPTWLYDHMLWGSEFPKFPVFNCTSIVVNFGQWALSHQASHDKPGKPPTPWSAARYHRQVALLAPQLQALQAQGKRVWWVTISSHSYVPWFASKKDFRTDPYLLLFNSIAYRIMREAGIPVIDTFTMTDALKDLSYDGYHYRGYVGHWATAAVAHELCSEGT